MGNVTITLTTTESELLSAHAAIKGTTIEALVSATGVTNSVREAISFEVSAQIKDKTVGEDIKDELAKDHMLVQQKVNNLYSQGTIPTSILEGLKARIPKK